MNIYRTDTFPIPLPEGHRFPAEKYRILAQRLLDDNILSGDELLLPRVASRTELLRVHTPEYLRRLERGEMTDQEMRRIGLPWSPELVNRARRSVGATVESCFAALSDDVAISLSGGTHHAFADRGEGFCLLNDVAVAARALQAAGRVERILVIDADVHQGNGTAAIFQNDPTVFTFSIHGRNNYPFHKQPGDLDVSLEDGTDDATYLEALRAGLRSVGGRFGAEVAIYLAGADPYQDDVYGRLATPRRGWPEGTAKYWYFAGNTGFRWPSPWLAAMRGTLMIRWTFTLKRFAYSGELLSETWHNLCSVPGYER